MPSLVQLIKDSYSIEISEESLSMKNGEELETPKRTVSQIPGLEWHVFYYPAGESEDEVGYVSIYLAVSKPVDARFVFAVKNAEIEEETYHSFKEGDYGNGEPQLASHEAIRKSGAIQEGKFVITCDVEFEIPIKDLKPLPPIHDLLIGTCPQVVFKVGDETVEMNKAIITSVSPVFNAMFSHDTKEAKTGYVKIEDFDYDTVDRFKDFCLGMEFDNLTTDEAIEMLKFADKYDIQGLQKYLESLLGDCITEDNLCKLAIYAWTYSRDVLKTKCVRYFSNFGSEIVLTTAFADLDPNLMASLVKAAVELKNE